MTRSERGSPIPRSVRPLPQWRRRDHAPSSTASMRDRSWKPPLQATESVLPYRCWRSSSSPPTCAMPDGFNSFLSLRVTVKNVPALRPTSARALQSSARGRLRCTRAPPFERTSSIVSEDLDGNDARHHFPADVRERRCPLGTPRVSLARHGRSGDRDAVRRFIARRGRGVRRGESLSPAPDPARCRVGTTHGRPRIVASNWSVLPMYRSVYAA